MSTASTPSPGDAAADVALADVEGELALRVRALKTSAHEPVQQARMSNLVIYCDRRALADTLAATVLPAVVIFHPARVLLLVAEPDGKTGELTAQVAVRAHEAGDGRKVFCEQVTLLATGPAVQRLPFAVRGLVIGDLPTNLWWAAPLAPPLAGVLFHDLAEEAEQVVFDSIGWPVPARGVAATAVWLAQLGRGPEAGRWRVASDLNWRRLKAWRRLLAQALDPAVAPGVLEGISEVALEHGPHAVVQAWELVSWLAARLGWKVQAGRVQPRVEIDWQLDGPHGKVRLRLRRLEEGPPVLRQVCITSVVGGKAGTLRFTVEEEGQRLAVVPQGADAAPRTMTVPPQSLAELVGRQLSDRERDPVFRASMAVARVLAESVLGQTAG
jgi:glucose-6-phosphate dehydrogenase assembly protein OpcA